MTIYTLSIPIATKVRSYATLVIIASITSGCSGTVNTDYSSAETVTAQSTGGSGSTIPSTSSGPIGGGSTSTGGTAGSGGEPGSGAGGAGGSVASPPEALANGSEPFAIALDQTHVYWTDIAEGRVNAVPKHGGSSTTLAISQPRPAAIAVDDHSVYWVNIPDGPPQSGTVMKTAKTGGAPITLAAGFDLNCSIAIDDMNVYFATNSWSSTLMKVAKSGGSPIVLVANTGAYSSGLAVDDTAIFWATGAYFDGGNKDDFCDLCDLLNVSKTNGNVTVLANTHGLADGLVVDETTVYWSIGWYDLGKIAKTGGIPLTLWPTATGSGLAVDNTAVFFGCQIPANAVMKMAKDGSDPTILATGQQPHEIAVDDTSVYWTEPLQGLVMKVAK